VYSALFYLQYHSLKNRLLLRFRRLKQPKYLVGGIVGALYFYFYFFRYLFGIRGSRQAFTNTPVSADLGLYESIGACLFFIAVLIGWLFPHERAALTFTEAEVTFLFPAPISRRGLIHFKLLRSQAAILFTTFFLMLVTNRFGGKFWIHAAGWWFILSTLNLHLLGSSFARTMLLDRGISNWQRRLVILLLLVIVALGVGLWAWHTLPRFDTSQWNATQPDQMMVQLQRYFHEIITSGPVPYLLYPFRLIVRPYLAPDGLSFLKALFPAIVVLAVHYVWVIRSNVAFEEASVDASRKLAEKVAAVRSGNWQAANKKLKRKRPPFVLRPTGPPIVALMWKNLISAGQAFTLRMWIVLAILAVVLCLMVSQMAANSGVLFGFGMAGFVLFIWSLFLGPQLLRNDLRQDLKSADVLKMYPLQGWQLVLGELLAPAVILTAVQWCLLLFTVGLICRSDQPFLGGMISLAIGLGAAVLVPTLNLIILLIPNAAVLLFPAWFLPGKEGAQGIEATGQRIIFMLGQLLVFLLTLIPASIGFLVVFLLIRALLGLTLAIPLASIMATIVLAAEGALGLMLLGHFFDRFDLSSELNN
jgi:hypothetical protein